MARWTFHALANESTSTLERLMRESEAPTLASISGWEFRGWNVLPAIALPLFWAMANIRFIKVFYQDPGDPPLDEAEHIRGVNLMVTRGGRRDPWLARPSDAEPGTQGVYHVYPPSTHPKADEYPKALFLDYFQPENGLFTGKYLTDYMVQPDPDNPDVLLGKAYQPLGPIRVGGFFILERLQPWRLAK